MFTKVFGIDARRMDDSRDWLSRSHHEARVRARTLRRASTDAERALWYRLRDRRLAGHKFRRQHPIGPYFADFACVEAGCKSADPHPYPYPGTRITGGR
jgi:hypothetical protein